MRLAGPAPLGRTPTPPAPPIPEYRLAEVQARLRRLALEPDPTTRIHATRGLSAFPEAAATELLLTLRTDPDWRVRVEVARGLARDRPAARVKDLEPLLGDPNPNVCVAAVEALATVGSPEDARPKLRDLLRDRRTRVRQVAFEVFLVREHGRGDPLPLEAMDEIERATREMIAQKDWSLRLLAVDGAVLLPIDLALPLLDRLIEEEPRVARAAVDPLLQRRARMRRDPILAQVGEILQRLLSRPDPVLRATTIESLGSIFADTTLPVDPSDWLGLQSILEQSRRYAVTFDRVADVRLATVAVAGQFPARPEMAALLEASAQDPEYLVRRAAVDAMRSGGLTPPREAEPAETAFTDSAYAAILSWAERDHWATLETAEGTIIVRLFSQDAPLTCWNFAQLASSGYFDRTRWHRVVPDFVLQAGCSRGDGFGGAERAIRCEINRHPFQAGTLGMALSGKDTGTSQFFVTHSQQPHLDGRYTAFGQVEDGQEAADRLVQGANLWSIRVTDQRP
jgi:cyclophilin family peptidyl-prolyl cis-trans isomerase/HEAT repeat protein